MCSSMRYTCMPNKYEVSVSAGSKVITCYKDDLEGWPWPWHITNKHVLLYEINLHATYKVSMCNSLKVVYFDLQSWPLTFCDDLDILPLNFCSSMKYMCMQNMKPLSLLVQKYGPKLKSVISPACNLTFDLKGWHWPWHITNQNVLLH